MMPFALSGDGHLLRYQTRGSCLVSAGHTSFHTIPSLLSRMGTMFGKAGNQGSLSLNGVIFPLLIDNVFRWINALHRCAWNWSPVVVQRIHLRQGCDTRPIGSERLRNELFSATIPVEGCCIDQCNYVREPFVSLPLIALQVVVPSLRQLPMCLSRHGYRKSLSFRDIHTHILAAP